MSVDELYSANKWAFCQQAQNPNLQRAAGKHHREVEEDDEALLKKRSTNQKNSSFFFFFLKSSIFKLLKTWVWTERVDANIQHLPVPFKKPSNFDKWYISKSFLPCWIY